MAANFFEWEEVFPELSILLHNFDAILEEIETVGLWMPWPEDHFAANVSGSSESIASIS